MLQRKNKRFGRRPWERRKLLKAVTRTAKGLKHCAFCAIPNLLFHALMTNSPESAVVIAMLHCKIVACKRYLAAAFGTL
jgi:hypothetical protein